MAAPCCGGGGVVAGSDGSVWSYIIGIALACLTVAPARVMVITPYLALVVMSPGQLHATAAERMYTSPEHKVPVPLPTLSVPEEVQLSVVVPMYNEEKRLPTMLDEALSWLEQVRSSKESLSGLSEKEGAASALTGPLLTYELLLVDDGSKDSTYDVAMTYAKERSLPTGASLRITQLHTNRGKGAAVRHGVLHSRGAFILFADADGATRFSDLRVLSREMTRILTEKGHGVVVGSRAHLVTSEAVVKRSMLRNLLMRGFHLLLSILMRPPSIEKMYHHAVDAVVPQFLRATSHGTVTTLAQQPEIKDTQCGFKMFSRATAAHIFPLAHIDRWIFDVELLLLAEMASRASAAQHALRSPQGSSKDALLRLPLPIAEVAVHWTEIDGSKISLLTDSLRMGRDLVIIRLNYALGRWRAPSSL